MSQHVAHAEDLQLLQVRRAGFHPCSIPVSWAGMRAAIDDLSSRSSGRRRVIVGAGVGASADSSTGQGTSCGDRGR